MAVILNLYKRNELRVEIIIEGEILSVFFQLASASPAMAKQIVAAVCLVCLILLAAAPALVAAHGAVPQYQECFPDSEGRIFIADNTRPEPAILVMEMPSGNISHRILVPPASMTLALSRDKQHILVFRGRDTNLHYTTIIHTGIPEKSVVYNLRRSLAEVC